MNTQTKINVTVISGDKMLVKMPLVSFIYGIDANKTREDNMLNAAIKASNEMLFNPSQPVKLYTGYKTASFIVTGN